MGEQAAGSEAAEAWHVAVFDGARFNKLVTHRSIEAADAYADGLSDGADLMGDNFVSGYVLPGGEDSMREFEDAEEVLLALAALAEATERRVAAEAV